MNVFHYHPETGAYVGEGQADCSPLEPGVWLIPASATNVAPPVTGAGQIAVFTDSWTVCPDQRGMYYRTVQPLGEEVEWANPVDGPENCTKLAPPTPSAGEQLEWTGEEWQLTKVVPPPEPTFKEKLSRLGITIEDLKAELGLAAAAPAVSEPAPVEPEWSAMTKAEIAAYCQDTFGETLDTNQLKDELIARAHELWVIANS